MKRLILILFLAMQKVAFAADVNVLDYGAKADGITENTLAIQNAVDACAVTGGKVIFPAGTYLTATISLKSNVTLYLSNGCVIKGVTDYKKYPYQNHGVHFYGEKWAKQALIYAYNLQNVGIEGSGTLDGQGASFVVNTIKKPDRYMNRPYLLWFVKCKKVSVKGVHLQNSAFWMQHYLGCEDVAIDGISIWNHSNKNNDMMDIDGCKNVTISNINGDSDDDGITLKSTSTMMTENVVITNCLLSSHCNALKFGTESTGGFRNITVSNCVIRPSRQTTIIYGRPAGNGGVCLEMVDGGLMENINVNNIMIEGPQVPLFIRLGNRARQYMDGVPVPPVGKARNIHISNITAVGGDTTGCSVTGLPGYLVEDVSLSHIRVRSSGGGLAADQFKKVPEQEALYPEGNMFGKLPAYGLYVRHVKGISLNDVQFTTDTDDARPALAMDDVTNYKLTGTIINAPGKQAAAISLKNTANGLITGTFVTGAPTYFIWQTGANTGLSATNNYHPAIKPANQFKISK